VFPRKQMPPWNICW